MKIELHVHTHYSKDSLLNKYFLLLFCKIKRIGCLVITDHNNIKAGSYKDFFESKGIQIICGEEIMTQEGEVIGLFLKKKVMPMMTVENTIQEIKRQGGFVYIPHPVDSKRYKTVIDKREIIRNALYIDFIEIYNGRNSSIKDADEAIVMCNELKRLNPDIVTVVGSDAHICWEIGRNVGILDEKKLDVTNFKFALKYAKFEKSNPLLIAHKWTRLVKFVRLFRTLETMKYDVAPIAEIETRSCVLAEEIQKSFHPEIVVFVAKGGFIIGNTISNFWEIPLFEICTERKGSKLKKIIAPIFRILPPICRFWLIDLEMNMGIHKKASDRKVIVSKKLQEFALEKGNAINNILIIDDSVDTGITANAVKKKIKNLFPRADIKFAALCKIHFSESVFDTDYYLYKDTIIKTGTSKDSSEYEKFISAYTLWSSAQM